MNGENLLLILTGLLVFSFLAWAISPVKKKINLRIMGWGLGI